MRSHNQLAGCTGWLLVSLLFVQAMKNKAGQFLRIDLTQQWGFVAKHPMFQGKNAKNWRQNSNEIRRIRHANGNKALLTLSRRFLIRLFSIP
jgi:hypothetical protein